MSNKTNSVASIMRRIAADLDQFEEQRIGLRTLIDYLMNESALLPDDWDRKQDLEECWSEMEILYAMAAEQGKDQLSDVDTARARGCIAELRKIVKPYLR